MQFRLFTSLRGWRPDWLPRDLLAGLMLAAIAIPGQLATARLAGMPPETGLYAFAAASIAFAAFGANRFMSVGADSTIAPIFAGGLASVAVGSGLSYPQLASLLALVVGTVLVVVGLLRAGWLATLLSVPVVTGFLAGIAVHIVVGELPALLGVAGESGHVLFRLVHVLAKVPDANPYALAVGLGVLATTIIASRISARIPGALIGLVAAGCAVALFGLKDHGVSLLGALSVPLPQVSLPGLPDFGTFGRLLQLALVVAMVCIMQTAAVAGTFPSDEGRPDNVSRDFSAVGAGSLLAGLVGSFPVDSSPPRTAIVRESGGRSQVASLAAVALIVVLAAVASGLMAYVPHAALSGILVYIALRIFRIDQMRQIRRRGGSEILLVLVSAALVIVLPIETGMLLAIVMSFVHSLYVVARPSCAELARVAGTTVWWPPAPGAAVEHVPGVLVIAPGAPLNFTNADHIGTYIRAAIAGRNPAVKLLVIEATGMIDIDYTGSQILRRLIAELGQQGVSVAMARLSAGRAQAQAQRTGLIDTLGADHVFMSVEDAVRKLGPIQSSSP
ncbi:SulP family inorganic anion transporter [Variovorax sp. J22P168]|uniref:SulP family inorganic anion transporter n=1 Tax=Variovorax jilinensis TaxID=3053513 RepID=UPI0025757627|nr:SulP family inorganic anion transporter [Variovorax sp. J22P168]MDM0014721.1 SulP family inorganic anion transporter [Variovorax sp. J22P168]